MGIDVEAAYARYGPMVLRRCRRLLRDEERAVDAMHDTFVRLIRNERRLDDHATSSLLFTMATNVCLNELRRQGRKPETSEQELLQEIAREEDTENRTLAARVLAGIFLGERSDSRTMAVLHWVDGMTYEEVAAAVGMSASGVRKRLKRLEQKARHLRKEREKHVA